MVIAMDSASELEYQFLFCRDLGLIDDQIFGTPTNETIDIRKMLNAFTKTHDRSVREKKR